MGLRSTATAIELRARALLRTELKGTTDQLGLLVDDKSYFQCKAIGCCPVIPKRKGPAVLEPCSKPGDAKEVDKDREALAKDRFYLDAVRDELFKQRRANNQFKAKLDLKEVDLEGREKKLKKDKEVFDQNQTVRRYHTHGGGALIRVPRSVACVLTGRYPLPLPLSSALFVRTEIA
jgi:hypothetical protein